MAWWNRGGGAVLEPKPEVTLAEVLAEHDIVAVHDEPGSQFMVVAEREGARRAKQLADRPTADLRELGTTSPSPFTNNLRQEYNRELRGIQGLQKYDEMRRSDATTRGTLRLVKTPVLAARWYMKPASESTRDKNVAEFVWKNLTEWMSISWPQLLTESLLMLDFGYYMFEKVYVDDDPRADGKVIWRKLAPRHPMDVKEWHMDKNGGPEAVSMNPPDMAFGSVNDGIKIPIEKLLVFSFDKEAGNIEGIPLLRSAYKHWYYKEQLYKIDAIQKERHGIGIPIIKLPPNFSPGDRTLAENMGRNLRTNERAHIVLPPNWEILFAKLEGQHVDALKSAEHHDRQIHKNILAPFLEGGSKDEDQVMFLKATRFIADIVIDVFNKYAIPQLVDYNWSRVGYPTLHARRIGEQADWRTMSFAVRNLIGSGVIRPDDRLEKALREEMDLPEADIETVRIVKAPQVPGATPATTPSGTPGSAAAPGGAGAPNPPAPPRVGPPRQNTAPVVAPPAPQAGVDKSGG